MCVCVCVCGGALRHAAALPQDSLYSVLEKGDFPTVQANIRAWTIKQSFRVSMLTIGRNFRCAWGHVL